MCPQCGQTIRSSIESATEAVASRAALSTDICSRVPGACPRCGRFGIFGYHDQEGALIWYCGEHRLGRFFADARRVETIETEGLRDAE
jgi:hypothetical protein